MLTDEVPMARLRATRRLGRLMATVAGRRRLASVGAPPGTPIVPADSDEAVIDVFDRIAAHSDGPAVLAVYFADRSEDEDLVLATWWGAVPAGTPRPEGAPLHVESVTIAGGVASGGGASIGMLVDSLDSGRTLDPSMCEISETMLVYAP